MFQYPKRQNVSIPPDQNMSQWTKCFNTPRQKYVPGGEMFQYPQLYTTDHNPTNEFLDFTLHLAAN